MDALSELINIVNRKRISRIDVLDKTLMNRKGSNLYNKLYSAISNKEVSSDDDASFLIYGTNKDDPRYKMLKSRLKEKVKNTVLFLDSTEIFQEKSQSNVYYNSLKNLLIIEILIKLNGTGAIVFELIREDYPIALKYKFYEILKRYSFHLLNYHSFKGDIKNYKKEEIEYLKFVNLDAKEQESKYLFWKILLKFTSVKVVTNSFLNELKKEIESFHAVVFYLNQIDIIYLYYYLLLLYYEISGDASVIIDVCDKIIALIEEYPEIDSNSKKYLTLYYKMKASLHLKLYDDGLDLLKSSKNIIPLNSNNNWFALKEFEFKLFLQSNRIEDSKLVYQEVLKNKFLKRQIVQNIEKWKIFNAYLVFMDNYLHNGAYKFSFSKFFNEVPVSYKDKSGYNFAIRLVEILFHFARKEYNYVFQKTEALRVYRTRYLNDNTYKRNHLLLSMLLKAEKLGFKGKEMKEFDFPELKELELKSNHIIPDWEIIPFEVLWRIIMELSR